MTCFEHVSKPIVPVVTAMIGIHVAGMALALLLAILAAAGYWRLRGTTLTTACLWTGFAAGCLAASACGELEMEGVTLSALRFGAACATFCPLMSVLGAKRPQEKGWNWVVISLWVVLQWPAIQAALLPAGNRIELFAAWKLFLWGLIGLGLLNYLPTRLWLAAVLVAVGQVVLLQEYLGLELEWVGVRGAAVGLGCFVVAGVVIFWCSRPALPLNGERDLEERSAQRTLLEFERLWLRFRDSYGAFWALRVLGRVNHSAELRGWPLVLEWGGFAVEGELSEEQLGELRVMMEGVLRRFLEVEGVSLH